MCCFACVLQQKGDASTSRDDVELPAGWEWKDEWQVDLNRAVDEYGKLFCTDLIVFVRARVLCPAQQR